MPHSTSDVERIFHEAIQLPREQWREFITAKCCSDFELQSELELLLESHERNESDDFIVGRASPPSTLDIAPVAEGAGDTIGRYKLLEQIGEGGMGLVYMAEQTAGVRRRVALKIIRLGMDTQGFIARFEAERQAMALFDHPNIARVLDAGSTSTGRPYFVMELVRGVDIASYLQKEEAPLADRLKLFVKVCQAIHHAHQKGVIHRDLKPTNILVTQFDGVPVPKVIDFGIAKAIGQQRLTDKTLFTGFASMVGTPQYMSPEQAEMTGLDIDIRTDIYSLGVLLYELITGSTPLEAKSLKQLNPLALAETLRDALIETPSTRLSRLQSSHGVSVLNRETPKPLSVAPEKLKGGLDWIVMKSIARDRRERYQSAMALSEDVERFLSGDPVQAAPPSKTYVLRTLMRKYRGVAFSAVTMTTVLVIATGVCSVLAISNYKTNKQLADSNKELSNTVQRLERAEATIKATALLEQYQSAISIALMKYEFDVMSSSSGLLEFAMGVPIGDAEPSLMPLPDFVSPAENIQLMQFGPTDALNELTEFSEATLLDSALQPIRDFIERARKQMHFEMITSLGGAVTIEPNIAPGFEFPPGTSFAGEPASGGLQNESTPYLVEGQANTLHFEPSKFRELEEERSRQSRELRDEFYRHLLTEYRRVFGQSNARVAEALNLLAACLIEKGEIEEAEARLRESLVVAEQHDKDVATKLLSSISKRENASNRSRK
ncbi:MAG: serine/threonine-protein kinase [Planctomycetota bacterium]